MPLSIGQILNNRYSIARLIGEGGFGSVYQGWDNSLDVAVAIKENLDTSVQAQKQFGYEAHLLARLSHPNLPRVTDHFFIPDQGQYLVMDFVQGEDLQTTLNRLGPLPQAQVLPWIDQVCDALVYLHNQDPPIIHRDLKPANIKIRPDGRAMLVDFGIAKVYDSQLKTTIGARAVTPGYSPPEQYGQGQTDARSDIYALGATLYTLLTGEQPAESVLRMVGAVQLIPPRRFNPHLTPRTESVMLKALEVDTRRRFQNAVDLRAALSGPSGRLPPNNSRSPQKSAVKPTPGTTGSPSTDRVIEQQLAEERGWSWIWMTAAILLGLFLALLGAAGWWYSTSAWAGNITVRAKDDMPQVYVPAGTFQMGSAGSDHWSKSDEKPLHQVTVDNFWLDQTEVTNAQYNLCVAAGVCQASIFVNNPYYNQSDQPVVGVSWLEAMAYCRWVGGRLPTEAEWEYAARGPESRLYPWGNRFDGARLNYCDQNCSSDWKDNGFNDGYAWAAPVGSYRAGASWVGAMDLAGNVWEWVSDWHSPYPTEAQTNPTGPANGSYKIARGGSWYFGAADTRAANRFSYLTPTERLDNIGFRCLNEPTTRWWKIYFGGQ